ncbi:MAG: hypothetical protein KME35_18920 [Aphanocapsa sp. GSE-SYN-MK-11-07L]|nr:hypothetical protein [Aphanocapsa sp. GSE-SYN-MK-11-07L]
MPSARSSKRRSLCRPAGNRYNQAKRQQYRLATGQEPVVLAIAPPVMAPLSCTCIRHGSACDRGKTELGLPA